MIKRIIYFTTILFCCFSCLDTEDDFVQAIPEIMDADPNEGSRNIIDSFKWNNIIDVNLLQSKKLSVIRYPLIYQNTVIFSEFEKGGFVAFDRFTGQQIWDNRGSFNTNSIFNPRIHKGVVYFVSGSGLRAFDALTGAMIHNTTVNVGNEFLNADFGIYKDKIYVHADDFNFVEPIFDEWRVNDVLGINKEEWVRFNRVEPAMNNGDKRLYYEPSFFEDENGDDNMIYMAHESSDRFITGTIALISYNLSADSIKWVQKDFKPRGGLSRAPKIDGNRIYTLGKEYAICLSAETGDVIWDLGPSVMKDELTGYADYFIHEDKFLIFGRQEQILCLNKTSGAVMWARQSDTPSPNVNIIDNIGTMSNSVNVYNNRAYYINNSGLITSVRLQDGLVGPSYRLPTWIDIEAHDVRLFEQTFRPHMTISEDGVIYVDDGFRFLAFDIP